MAHRQETITRMADLLQSGWTLMQRNCPDTSCSTPLVRNREGKLLCASCSQWFIEEDNVQAAGLKTGASSRGASAPSSVGVSVRDVPRDGRSREELYAQLAAGAQEQSKAQEKEEEVVIEDDYEEIPEDFSHTWQNERDEVREEYGLSDRMRPASPATRRRNERLNEASKKMGEKLLMGWAMLDQSCPNESCGCPLMRNRDGTLYCVACDIEVVLEQDYDPSKHTAVNRPEEPKKEEKAVRAQPAAASAANPDVQELLKQWPNSVQVINVGELGQTLRDQHAAVLAEPQMEEEEGDDDDDDDDEDDDDNSGRPTAADLDDELERYYMAYRQAAEEQRQEEQQEQQQQAPRSTGRLRNDVDAAVSVEQLIQQTTGRAPRLNQPSAVEQSCNMVETTIVQVSEQLMQSSSMRDSLLLAELLQKLAGALEALRRCT